MQAEGGAVPEAFFSGSLTPAQLQCVDNCQSAQTQAAAAQTPFNWAQCQQNCGV